MSLMKKIIVIALFTVLLVAGIYLIAPTKDNVQIDNKYDQTDPLDDKMHSNLLNDDRMLLVLFAPSIHTDHYSDSFEDIVEFQINYAKGILGHDNVIIFVDADTRPYYENKIPEDILLTEEIYDIWARDFTTVDPESPVQFVYTWASMSKRESQNVQNSFDIVANKYEIQRTHTTLLIDGGNLVDNYAGKVITTTRFLEDNELTYDEGKQSLKDILGATEVAIIEPDEDLLAHSDGMVMWIDEETLLINDYSSFEKEYREAVHNELELSFPTVTIIEVPVEYDENMPDAGEISSACGINVNSVMTYDNIYVPIFDMPHEQDVLDTIRSNTNKNVIPINAEGVCALGGSVRCLTWQLTGTNADKLINAARNEAARVE